MRGRRNKPVLVTVIAFVQVAAAAAQQRAADGVIIDDDGLPCGRHTSRRSGVR